MLIVHISDSKEYRGGENQLVYLLSGIKNYNDIECVAIAQRDSKLHEKLINGGVETIPVNFSCNWNFLNIMKLSKILKGILPDLIAVHTSGSHSKTLIAEYIGRMNIPIVVHRRYPGKIKRFSSYKYRSPKIRHYIAISKHVAKQLINGGVDKSQVSVVYSGIEIPSERKLSSNCSLVIGTVAALTREKNLVKWIEIFNTVSNYLPDIKGIIAGNGTEKENLIRRIKGYGLDGKLSIVPYEEDIWQDFSVFLSTSLIEGLGTALLQAMAFGIPVIAPNVGGIPEIIKNGYNGFLIDGWNVMDYVVRILDLLTDSKLYKRLSQSGRKTAQNFSIDRMVSHTMIVYRKILSM